MIVILKADEIHFLFLFLIKLVFIVFLALRFLNYNKIIYLQIPRTFSHSGVGGNQVFSTKKLFTFINYKFKLSLLWRLILLFNFHLRL